MLGASCRLAVQKLLAGSGIAHAGRGGGGFDARFAMHRSITHSVRYKIMAFCATDMATVSISLVQLIVEVEGRASVGDYSGG